MYKKSCCEDKQEFSSKFVMAFFPFGFLSFYKVQICLLLFVFERDFCSCMFETQNNR